MSGLVAEKVGFLSFWTDFEDFFVDVFVFSKTTDAAFVRSASGFGDFFFEHS